MCSLSKIAVTSEAVVFQEVLYVSLCFDVLRWDVEHTSEDMSSALRFDVGLQVTYLYVSLFDLVLKQPWVFVDVLRGSLFLYSW